MEGKLTTFQTLIVQYFKWMKSYNDAAKYSIKLILVDAGVVDLITMTLPQEPPVVNVPMLKNTNVKIDGRFATITNNQRSTPVAVEMLNKVIKNVTLLQWYGIIENKYYHLCNEAFSKSSTVSIYKRGKELEMLLNAYLPGIKIVLKKNQ